MKIISLLWEILFCLSFLVYLMIYFIYLILKLFLPRKVSRHILQTIARFWAKMVVLSTGSKVVVTGKENLPSSVNICFVSNHQGLFDIPVILGFLGVHTGFVAKRELFRIPVLSQWMREIPCTFIDRRNPRKAIQTFQKSAELIKKRESNGYFPGRNTQQKRQNWQFSFGKLKITHYGRSNNCPFSYKR